MDAIQPPFLNVKDDFDPGSYGNTLFMCILYLSLGMPRECCMKLFCPLSGIVAIIANIFNIAIFWTNRELRTNYVLIIALDIGEIINGVSYILTGLGRGTQLLLGNYQMPITVHDCFYTVGAGLSFSDS